MPAQADQVYRTSEQIVDDILAAFLARIPDANTGPDSIIRIWAEVFANTAEGMYLANQLLHDDMFIQTAGALALQRDGEEYGRPQKGGTIANGEVVISGSGGTFIPTGSQFGSPRPSLDDELVFVTTEDATIPNPGIPTAPVAADHGSGATHTNGVTYEYAVSFLTVQGETEVGAISTPFLAANAHNVDLTAVPLGGPGTTQRTVYRRSNGGPWKALHTIANNTTTTYTDNVADGAEFGPPLDTSTAEAIAVSVSADEAGSDWNVAPNTVTDLLDAPQGVTGVTNPESMSGGSDGEDTETFRAALLAYVRAPGSGGPDDLIAWAENIDGVDSASVFPNVNLDGDDEPGSVVVRIAGPGGTVPDDDVVEAVLTYLDSHDLANITIYVGTFDENDVDVTAVVGLADSYTLDDVTSSVEDAINDYINSIPVGGTVYVAGLVAAIFGLPGTTSVAITDPSDDVTSTNVQKPVLGTPTVESA